MKVSVLIAPALSFNSLAIPVFTEKPELNKVKRKRRRQ